MNQMQATTSASFVQMEYGGYGGFEVNDMLGPAMAPVGVPEMNNEGQGNNAAFYPQAENRYYPNNNYFDPRTEEIMRLKADVDFFRSESLFWQFEGNCSSDEKYSWKTQADTWKNEAGKWKAVARNWQADSLKWKAEATNWQAESAKRKAQVDKCHAEYCKTMKQGDAIWRLWRECEDTKVANFHNYQSTLQKLTLERDEKNKIIEKQRKELLDEKQRCAMVQAELKAQTEAVEKMKNHEKMVVTTLRNQALAKENELRNKLEDQTREYENFAAGTNGRVSELEDKVRSLQSDLEQRESIIGGFDKYCGQLYESKRQANVELRELKDFMVSLTCDLQDNLGKFMRKYGLSVTPELESKWDWRTKEEKCLVSHLKMLVTLTEGTFQEWEEKGMLKQKQACGDEKTTGNAAGTSDVMMTMDERRSEKRALPGCSSNAPAAGRSGSTKKWKF